MISGKKCRYIGGLNGSPARAVGDHPRTVAHRPVDARSTSDSARGSSPRGMASFHLAPPDTVPANLLFPEAYAHSKRMVAFDFLFFGVTTVTCVLLGAVVNLTVVMK